MENVVLRLPDIGEGLAEGELVRWLVAEGDEVTRDQPLVEVLTDKATVELPSPVAGRVARLLVEVGQLVPVGGPLVELEPATSEAPPTVAPSATATATATATAPPAGPRPKAAPATRRLALELGVDLPTVSGTGPGGRITVDDVRASSAPPAPAHVPLPAGTAPTLGPGIHPLRGVRRLTAAAMTRSWREVPHIHVGETVDATHAVELLERLGSVRPDGPRITPLTLFVAAAARALRRHPLVNASLDAEGGTITVHEAVHVGVAVATDDGLLVPVLRDADRGTLPELATRLGELVAHARSGRLDPDDLRSGTFTISNYGRLGGEWATPIIRPPEAAIAGFGAVRFRPHVVGDGPTARVEPRRTLPVVLGADHRLIDGDLAVAFLTDLTTALAEPLTLLLPDTAP